MDTPINFRPAQEKDVAFLVTTVIHAEKSGTDRLSYATIFEMTEEEVRDKLTQIMLEDLPGQELCISSFVVAEVQGQLAGACGSWVEGAHEIPGHVAKANLLYHYFGKQACERAKEKATLLQSLHFSREPGTIQFESAYVSDKFKGLGISSRIMIEHARKHFNQYPDIRKAQIIMAKTNENAYRAHAKVGFRLVAEKTTADPRALLLLPASTMILIESPAEELKKHM